jgi:hypothetical protein
MITYLASVLIYSGRPDPVWELPSRIADALQEYWKQLPPLVEEQLPPSSLLGYRGCHFMTSEREEWNAFDGVVMRKKNGISEVRYDQKRFFEKMLIKSSPTGMIPNGIIQL